MNVEIGLRPRNSFSGNVCFEFSVLCLCSEITKPKKRINRAKIGVLLPKLPLELPVLQLQGQSVHWCSPLWTYIYVPRQLCCLDVSVLRRGDQCCLWSVDVAFPTAHYDVFVLQQPVLPLDVSFLYRRLCCQDMSFLQQPVFFLDVSGLQRHMLTHPDVSFLYSRLCCLDVSSFSSLCSPCTFLVYNGMCCPWLCLFNTADCAAWTCLSYTPCAVPGRFRSTVACAVPGCDCSIAPCMCCL
jgi:hypothetical protein